MEQIAGWMAPAATMMAAFMTAANLGPRVTGWGFVVFTLGALGWIAIGWATDQPNLLWQNVVLLLVDIFGIWRWLGRVARWDEGAAHAADTSKRRGATKTLFPASVFAGAAVADRQHEALGHSVDAMLRCDDGGLAYVVVRSGGVGGVGESLRAVDWRRLAVEDGAITLDLDRTAFEALAPIEPERWPERV